MPPTAEAAVNALLGSTVFRCPLLRRPPSSSIFNRIKRVYGRIDRATPKNIALEAAKSVFPEVFAC